MEIIIYLSLHCHHRNDSFIKAGGDESHFNVSLIVRDKVTRRCPQPTTFKEKGEPKQIRTEILLLTRLTPYRWARPAHQTSRVGAVLPLIKEAVTSQSCFAFGFVSE